MARAGLTAGGTIIGAIIGSAIAPGIGTAIGAGIGSALGTVAGLILFPIKTKIKEPELDDLSARESSYGVIQPWVWNEVRLRGNRIWALDLVPVESTESSGGKFGSSTKTTTIEYFASFADLFADTRVTGELVLGQIFAGGELIWDQGESEFADQIRWYGGTADQLPDSAIEADIGVGVTPAFRHRAYIVFDALPVTEDFQNSFPDIEAVWGLPPRLPTFTEDSAPLFNENASPSVQEFQQHYNVPYWTKDGVSLYTIYQELDANTDFKMRLGKLNTQTEEWESFDVGNTDELSSEPAGLGQTMVSQYDDSIYVKYEGVSPPGIFVMKIDPNTHKIVKSIFLEDCDVFGGMFEWPAAGPIIFSLDADNNTEALGFIGIACDHHIDGSGGFNNNLSQTNTGVIYLDRDTLVYRGVTPYPFAITGVLGDGDTNNDGDNLGFYYAGNQGVFAWGTAAAAGNKARLFMIVSPTVVPPLLPDFLEVTPWNVDADGFQVPRVLRYDESLGYLIADGRQGAAGSTYRWRGIDVSGSNGTDSAGTVSVVWTNVPEFEFSQVNSGIRLYGPMNGVSFAVKSSISGNDVLYKYDNTDGIEISVDPGSPTTRIDFSGDAPEWIGETGDADVDGMGGSPYAQNADHFIHHDPNISSLNFWTWNDNVNEVAFSPVEELTFGSVKYHLGAAGAGTVTLADIVDDLNEASGIDSTLRDATELVSKIPGGYALTSQTDGRRALEPLQTAFFFDSIETEGVLKYQFRNQASSFALVADDLRARSGTKDEVSLTETLINEIDLPSEMSVTHVDPDFDYQFSTQTARRIAATNASGRIATGNLAITMTVDEAKEIAVRGLYLPWTGVFEYDWSSALEHYAIDPGDVGTVTRGGVTVTAYVTEISIGDDNILRFKGISEDSAVHTVEANVTGSSPSGFVPAVIIPKTNTNLLMLDIPLLLNEHDTFGYYLAVWGDENWTDGSVYISQDNSTFSLLTTVSTQATIGNAKTVLADATHTTFDRVNAVDVTLTRPADTLESVTELDVLNGNNAALLWNPAHSEYEVFGFATATFVSTDVQGRNRYTLSTLLRGQGGTDHLTDGHDTGDTFVRLKADGSIRAINSELSVLGTTRYFKALTSGQALADVASTVFVPMGTRIKPLSPVFLDATWDGDDIVFTWTERSRFHAQWKVPTSEPQENWELDIHEVGSPDSVINTYSSTTNTITYTSAQQVADFGGNQTSIAAIGYQISNRMGRGYGSEKGQATTFNKV